MGTIIKMRPIHSVMWVLLPLLLAPDLHANTFGDMEVIHAAELMAAGEETETFSILERVITPERRGEIWTEARYTAARAALAIDRPETALTYLEGIEAELPEIRDFVHACRGRALRQLGKWSEALTVWTSLANDFPTSPHVGEAYYAIADAEYALGQLEEARRSYILALRKAPRLDRANGARFNIARVDEAKGRHREAAYTYRFLAFHRPTEALSQPAEERFDAMVVAGQTRPASFKTKLARIDRLLGKRLLEKAEEHLDALDEEAELPSRERALMFRWAQLAYRDRDFEYAVELFAKLEAGSSGKRQMEYRRWLARTYSAADETDKAIELYTSVADRYRRKAEGRESLYRAAWLAYNGRQHLRAVKLFSEFIDRYPTGRAAEDATWFLAWNEYRLGDFPSALETLHRFRDSYPESKILPRVLYWEARLLERTDQLDKAHEAYGSTVEVAPLSYYGALAEQRIQGMNETDPVLALQRKPVLLASLGPTPRVDEAESNLSHELSLDPPPDELPESGGMLPSVRTRLPWGAAVLDWSLPEGARALRLMRLGLHTHAAALVARLPELPGQEPTNIAYARARLLYALGDFAAAYRIGATMFRDEIQGRPSGRARRYFQIAYPEAHSTLVRASASEFSVSPLLILSVMRQESAFMTGARSWASAHGLMQIIPSTGRQIAVRIGDDSYSAETLPLPEINIRYGSWYLAQLIRKFHGNYILAIASYNAGPPAVSRWVDAAGGTPTDEFVEEIPFRETRNYVKRVLSNLAVYNTLYAGQDLNFSLSLPTDYLDNIDF